jgi:cbb3-type cytochrome oxidase maturation protein
MEMLAYGLLLLLALLMGGTAVYAFYWSSKTGQFRDFDAQSRVIFDASEPEGVVTDFFPGKAPHPAAPAPTSASPRHIS